VVVAVGGGGLVGGIATAVAARGVRVVGVEPDGSAALLPALAAGGSRAGAAALLPALAASEPVHVTPHTIASGLDAPYIGRNALAACTAAGVEVVTVPDDAIAAAMRRLYADTQHTR